jgi:DNA repair exonuclease SbcCD ATPase subunit
VEIEGVRCFGDPVHVVLSKDGINVLAGPNGSGKSTFIEAVRRCLLDLHTSAAASNLCPWADGRTPEITVEFEHGGSLYRLSKRFLKRKSAKLERKKGKAWSVLQEGKEADEEVRRLLRSKSAPVSHQDRLRSVAEQRSRHVATKL